jgi:hypothetical protein
MGAYYLICFIGFHIFQPPGKQASGFLKICANTGPYAAFSGVVP